MLTLKLNQTDHATLIDQVAAALDSGQLVIFPTETVYGFLVDATNPVAVQKLIQLKRRRPGKAISIAVSDQKMSEEYVLLNEQARQIYQTLLPGPITVISQVRKDKKTLLQPLLSEFSTLGIRLPAYPLLLELIKKLGRPVTATSANKAGGKNPYTIAAILNQFSTQQQTQIDLIVDAGQLPKRPPSVVIDTTQTTPLYFRGHLFSADSASHQADEKIISHSPEETQILAQKILFRHFDQLQNQGLLIALDGELGAGKTVFTQGIGQYLQIPNQLDSPTYTYLKEYNFVKNDLQGKLYHLDLWKINSAAELDRLHLDQLLRPGNLVVIEWFDQIKDFVPHLKPDLHLILTEQPDSSRKLTLYVHSR